MKSKKYIDIFRPFFSEELKSSPYPPYHSGLDLEETFIDFYLKNLDKFDNLRHIFIPVKWTCIYNNYRNLLPNLQDSLLNLPNDEQYFTVSQHDDAPHQILPKNTINFSAGGNVDDTIPIPLICSHIPYRSTQNLRDIFCSFIGSDTHPIRTKMVEYLKNNMKYVVNQKSWCHNINKSREELFIHTTERSIFSLCPRGYGPTSFRLYEAIQLGAIPVYIYDRIFLPFVEDIDWSNIIIPIHEKDMSNIDNILTGIGREDIEEKRYYAKSVYNKYFTLESIGPNILRILQNK